jgi:hypothetical protein
MVDDFIQGKLGDASPQVLGAALTSAGRQALDVPEPEVGGPRHSIVITLDVTALQTTEGTPQPESSRPSGDEEHGITRQSEG